MNPAAPRRYWEVQEADGTRAAGTFLYGSLALAKKNAKGRKVVEVVQMHHKTVRNGILLDDSMRRSRKFMSG